MLLNKVEIAFDKIYTGIYETLLERFATLFESIC